MAEGQTEAGWILFPIIQRPTDCAAMSEPKATYKNTSRSSEPKAVRGDMGKEVCAYAQLKV